jgi:hypothetical protein
VKQKIAPLHPHLPPLRVLRLPGGPPPHQSPAYAEAQEGRQLVHTAAFGATREQLATLAERWALVRGWKAARLEVDGAGVLPRERARLGEVLECAARAATFADPATYCLSAPGRTGRAGPAARRSPAGLEHLVHIDWL